MLNNWKPSLAIKASAALHVGAIGALGVNAAALWPWSIAALLANHAALTAAGLWPRSTALGDNMLRLSTSAAAAKQIALTIDDGPDPAVTPAVLDLLDAAQAKASFFCIGQRVQAHAQLAQEIVKRGHAIENHSFAHRHYFSLMGMKDLKKEISQAQDTIAQVAGRKPIYFRAPAGLRSPLLDPVLQALDLKLVSWTRRGFDTVSTQPEQIMNRLTRNLTGGDILLLHDGHCAKSDDGTPVVLQVLPEILKHIKALDLKPVRLDLASYTD